MLLNEFEVITETIKLQKLLKRRHFIEWSMIAWTSALLLFNLIFVSVVLYGTSDVKLQYSFAMFGIDFIMVLVMSIWIRSMYKQTFNHVPIPYYNNILSVAGKIVNGMNVFIAVLVTFSDTLHHTDSKEWFKLIFGLQIIFIFLVWDLFIQSTASKIDKRFMRKMKKFISFDIYEATKYYVYIQNHYVEWANKYNAILRKAHEKKSFLKRIYLIFTKWDWTNTKWEKDLIDENVITAQDLEKIFNNESITTTEEFFKYRFCIIVSVFMFIFKDSQDVKEEFDLFYWIRDPETVKKFTDRIREFKNL